MFGNRFSSSITCSRWRHETKPGRLDQSRSCRFLKVATHPFSEIIAHPIPLDLNTLKSLKRSPLGLDLYLWLTYRTFALKRPLRLTWPLIYRQFGADSARAGNTNTVNNFRTKCLRELKKIKGAWPDRNNRPRPGAADVAQGGFL